MVCDSAYLDLLFGYQLARYVGQDQVARIIKNDTWDRVPEALQAAEDIRNLILDRVYERNFSGRVSGGTKSDWQ